MNLRGHRNSIVAFCALALVLASAAGAADVPEDAYVAGYAAAVLERELKLSPRSLRVAQGVVTLDAADVIGDRTRVIEVLSRVRGVARVEIREAGTPPVVVSQSPARTPTSAPPTVLERFATGIFPGGQLFKPLIADPRWPHFAASYQYYVNEGNLRNVGAVNFGETFTLYRDQLGRGWWEMGIQAGVFAVFDLDARSHALVNADYLGAVVLGYRDGGFSALARLFHQSSHLGDEFLLQNRVNRVNLSYEGFDLRLSYELLDDVLRLYGGGGYLFNRDPSSLKPGSLQWGVEFRSPWPEPGARWRPIAAVDVQHREENDWHVDLSFRAGVEVAGVLGDRRVQLLLEYFRGHSPNGQFYKDQVDYLGLGVHFHF